MASEYTYLLTQKAEADLDGIVSYLSLELANAKAASDFVGNLQDVIEETLLFPLSGSLVNNEFLPDTAVRKKVIGKYVMYYLTDLEQHIIYILRLIYGRRSVEEIFKTVGNLISAYGKARCPSWATRFSISIS